MSKNIFKYLDVLIPFTIGEKKIYGRELSRKLNLNQKSVQIYLNELKKMGILKTEKKGKTIEFSLNKENILTEKLIVATEIKKFCDLTSNIFEVKEIIKDVLKNINGKVIIYGSFANGNWNEESDLDILIIGRKVNTEEIGEKYSRKIHFMFLSEKEFREGLKKGNSYIVEIMKNHVICRGFEEIINEEFNNE